MGSNGRPPSIRRWRDLPVGAKLGLGFAIVIAMTVAMGGGTLWLARDVERRTRSQAEVSGPLADGAVHLQAAVLAAGRHLDVHALTGEPAALSATRMAMASADARMDAMRGPAGRADPGITERLEAITGDLARFSATIDATAKAVAGYRTDAASADQVFASIDPILSDAVEDSHAQLDQALRGADKAAQNACANAYTFAVSTGDEYRNLRRAYLVSLKDRNPAALADASGSLDNLGVFVGSMRAAAKDPARAGRLDQITAGLDKLRQALAGLDNALRNLATNDVERTAVIAQVVDRADRLATDMQGAQQQAISGILAATGRLRLVVLALAAAAASGGILLAIAITRAVVRPLRLVTRALQAVAAGDLGQQLAEDRRDELGRISAALNATVSVLRRQHDEISRAAGRNTAMSTRLGEAVGGLRRSVEGSAKQSASVSTAAEEISANASTVATAAEELAASSQEISRNIGETAQVARHANELTSGARSTMEQLGRSSQEIGDVVKTISGIASQTNLLALNATIEAARAGESGRGFAVVASEVKALARRTADATAEVSRRIDTIRSDADASITAIAQIAEVVGRIDAIAQSVAAAVEQQVATTNEITRNAGEAARGSTAIARDIGTVAEASRDADRAVGEVQGAVDELHQLATQLARLVGQRSAEPATVLQA